jgi:HAD superfamily hydrolase (TIGR01509 family)
VSKLAKIRALVFDCDGTLAETERDGHRVAFNQAFREENIRVQWDVAEYGDLLKIAGGKERMQYYFELHRDVIGGRSIDDNLIQKLHKRKTEIYSRMGSNGEMPARTGITRLIDEAHDQGLMLFVCSTSNKDGVITLIRAIFGEHRLAWFTAIYAGDIVKAKKPAPDIYNLVKENFGLSGEECMVIEDNRNGLLAAKSAGMHCLVTVSYYSRDENLEEADLVVSSLGEPGGDPIEIWATGKSTLLHNMPAYISLQTLRQIAE